jgi:5-methylthioadenosine/S-adenosylhomocysteine deaminase
MYRLHAEEALTQSELRAASEAHARGERIVMHAAETRHRITVASKSFGMSTVRLLESYGLLSERVLLSHAVYVDEEERALLAERRVPIVSSPSAEMKLSDGIAPIHDYLARGITVALGTDSAICNNSGDLLLECRQLGLSQKLACGPEALRAGQVLRCATAGGAAALGEASERGTISTGLAADLILLDTRNTRLQPLLHNSESSNLAANVVYAATGQDVTDVMIGGRWVVRGRKLLTADQDEISAELGRAASRLHERIA